MDVLEIRYDAQNGHVADFLEHTPPLVEETHVAPEFIDDDALDALSVVGCLQGDAAIDRSEDPAAVDVAHEDDIRLGMPSHW